MASTEIKAYMVYKRVGLFRNKSNNNEKKSKVLCLFKKYGKR